MLKSERLKRKLRNSSKATQQMITGKNGSQTQVD